ncbi:hypothetical protein [Streptomyces sp. NBC_00582]|uniref:hypothetical protein n=1 Tax=Streptomyces sp. NBC_00582 TaxID=2975783 RepID=UPI002E81862A|nr:hypothetical protein [Streptomyces sp. NBC_00582]WUB67446.1 hypothetical protein OG852_47175 [Streptomyces sp. NBC_00582]
MADDLGQDVALRQPPRGPAFDDISDVGGRVVMSPGYADSAPQYGNTFGQRPGMPRSRPLSVRRINIRIRGAVERYDATVIMSML